MTMSDYKQAELIVEKYAFRNDWTFPHDRATVDLLVALQNMQEMEENDELPAHIRPAYRVVIHSFAKLFERIEEGEDNES
jgi:hypothetical protein